MESDQMYKKLTNALEKFGDFQELDNILCFDDDDEQMISKLTTTTNNDNYHNNHEFYSLPMTINQTSATSSSTYDFRLSIPDSNNLLNNSRDDEVMIITQPINNSPENLCTSSYNTNSFDILGKDTSNYHNVSEGYVSGELWKSNDEMSNESPESEQNLSIPFPKFSSTMSQFKEVSQNEKTFNQSPMISSILPIKQEENNFPLDLSIPKSNEVILNPCKSLSLIPVSILNLHRNICNSFSEFSYVYAISAQMCQEILPMDYLVHLKMALLLSITSIETTSNQTPIPIIALGTDSSSINKIMIQIGNIAKRFISSFNDFNTGSLNSNGNFIEAGPLHLAKDGVCYFGELSALKPTQIDKILKIVEKERIFIEKTSISCPLNCAVWCYLSSFNHNQRKQNMRNLNTYLELFGIPIALDDTNLDKLIDFTLQKACNSLENIFDNEVKIPYEDLKNYISIVAKQKIEMTEEAKILLQGYFVLKRSRQPGTLSQKSFYILTKFSESFAKLCFHNEVQPDDVVGGILLTETFIKNIFGSYGHSLLPKFELKTNYIGEIDSYFKIFKNWLSEYLTKTKSLNS